MKKEVLKTGVILLVVGLIGVVIKLTYSSINEPPTNVPIKNLHKSSLEDKINQFSNEQSSAHNEKVYNDVINKIEIYQKEDFLTNREIDSQIESLVEKYLPIFIENAENKFRASVWNEAEHKEMLKRIKHLQTLKINEGTSLAVASYNEKLSRIKRIIKDYNDAKRASLYSNFYSINDAKAKIQRAEKYATSNPLHNCIELVEKLEAVKTKIGQSHYQKLKHQVSKMARYQRMTKVDFDTLVARTNRGIREYNENRLMYGRDAQTTDSLTQKSREYDMEAQGYYDTTLKEIRIDTKSQWARSHSPSDLYRAFVSSYNHNKNNTQARMFFTIKGYRNFTFYIRSNGEACCDYVMVGVNKIPTDSSNFSNTKNSPSSDASLQGYKSVVIRNLDPELEYTIQVVYTKDSVYHFGTDRGVCFNSLC